MKEETSEVGQSVRGRRFVSPLWLFGWISSTSLQCLIDREEESQITSQTRRRISDPQGVKRGTITRGSGEPHKTR
jgi:hypothetical protein